MKQIRNCPIRFECRCPESWDALTRTEDDNIRYCEVCKQHVYHCASVEELVAHAEAGRRVALRLPA